MKPRMQFPSWRCDDEVLFTKPFNWESIQERELCMFETMTFRLKLIDTWSWYSGAKLRKATSTGWLFLAGLQYVRNLPLEFVRMTLCDQNRTHPTQGKHWISWFLLCLCIATHSCTQWRVQTWRSPGRSAWFGWMPGALICLFNWPSIQFLNGCTPTIQMPGGSPGQPPCLTPHSTQSTHHCLYWKLSCAESSRKPSIYRRGVLWDRTCYYISTFIVKHFTFIII